MNKSLLTVTALIALSGIHAHAGNPRLDSVLPEIQISGGKSQIKLTPDSSSTNMNVVTPMNKSEAERPFLIRAFGKESAGTMWKEYTLTFTPQGTGDLWFSLSAPNAPKDDETLVFKVDYDKISATGAKLLNGDFEETGDHHLQRPRPRAVNHTPEPLAILREVATGITMGSRITHGHS